MWRKAIFVAFIILPAGMVLGFAQQQSQPSDVDKCKQGDADSCHNYSQSVTAECTKMTGAVSEKLACFQKGECYETYSLQLKQYSQKCPASAAPETPECAQWKASMAIFNYKPELCDAGTFGPPDIKVPIPPSIQDLKFVDTNVGVDKNCDEFDMSGRNDGIYDKSFEFDLPAGTSDLSGYEIHETNGSGSRSMAVCMARPAGSVHVKLHLERDCTLIPILGWFGSGSGLHVQVSLYRADPAFALANPPLPLCPGSNAPVTTAGGAAGISPYIVHVQATKDCFFGGTESTSDAQRGLFGVMSLSAGSSYDWRVTSPQAKLYWGSIPITVPGVPLPPTMPQRGSASGGQTIYVP
jgi:hypothetical protein